MVRAAHTKSKTLTAAVTAGMRQRKKTYLAGVNAIIILERVSTAVLRLVRLSFTQVVHAVLAARPAATKHTIIKMSRIENFSFSCGGEDEEAAHPQLRH